MARKGTPTRASSVFCENLRSPKDLSLEESTTYDRKISKNEAERNKNIPCPPNAAAYAESCCSMPSLTTPHGLFQCS